MPRPFSANTAPLQSGPAPYSRPSRGDLTPPLPRKDPQPSVPTGKARDRPETAAIFKIFDTAIPIFEPAASVLKHPDMQDCSGCHQPIYDRFVSILLDKPWHPNCIRCCECRVPLDDKCFEKDGQIYCREDYERRYGARKKCAMCELYLEKTDLVRQCGLRYFHESCFHCSKCQRKLETGENLYLIDGNQFVCQADFITATATTTSSTPSSTSNRPISAGNGSECNSDADDENGETIEDVGLDEDGEKLDDAAAAKRRGPRTTIKAKQLETLKNAFANTPKPTRHIREQLAQETGLNMRVIQVWFQNRRSKERRMKQMRYGGYRPARRSRGGRDDMCQDMFPQDPSTAGFFPQPMPFFCDPYASPERLAAVGVSLSAAPPLSANQGGGSILAHHLGQLAPPYMSSPDAHTPISHDGFDRTSPLNGGQVPQSAVQLIPHEYDSDLTGFMPLPCMYTTELKPMTGW